MVAYNFTTGIDAVAARTKCMTIRRRDSGKRHARPGEHLQLYTGMRTKQCRKLVTPDPVCLRVDDIDIAPDARRVVCNHDVLWWRSVVDLAHADGFDSVEAFFAFFRRTSSIDEQGLLFFPGIVIQWT